MACLSHCRSPFGKLFDDATVLRVGDAYEKATPWREKRPALTVPETA